MKTLRTKQAIRILKDIFETDINKSKADKAEAVRDFIRTYSWHPFVEITIHHFNEVFPDWFEDFVVYEWKPTSKGVDEQNEWEEELNE